MKSPTTIALTTTEQVQMFQNYSSIVKLKRIIAYCLRFIHNCKPQQQGYKSGPLQLEEVQDATVRILRACQQEAFPAELQSVAKHGQVGTKSNLKTLNPFLHTDGLLRVGGRLTNSHLPFEQQHPIILPSSHQITTMIIYYEHLKHLHGGIQFILAIIRTQYWPLGGRNTIKRVLRSCVRGCRLKPKLLEHVMGNLPTSRLQAVRPFTNTGIDYCGPFKVCQQRRRNAALHKGYVAVFVCFSTKATHLELVSNLTTEAFINALKRFVSRREYIANIYSDNATNFVGAKNEMEQISNLLTSADYKDKFSRVLLECNTKWHFIPPRSPHFGGLWEAAVKAAKYHIKRVVGDNVLTYEEMHTLIVQVEACLNSRPLTCISNDPNDLSALTPSHFLIGDSLKALPQPDVTQENVNSLTHWKKIQHMYQGFWNRWSKEYLSQLQQRAKWSKHYNQAELKVGQLVSIKENNLPPLLWKLGRIVQVHPGADATIRVVSIRTARGLQKVAVRNISIIPVQMDDSGSVSEVKVLNQC
ncbi:uncharacterized protein LOC116181919 [Photinus pyralis]|uniref:uncharacterized protein LOC116181919 n=1 Tax=Photinus pyralis TaxID=7054 RepID=UPI001267381D|nr:uncharacterized protein LOC116181919 [Photinus pyralis]